MLVIIAEFIIGFMKREVVVVVLDSEVVNRAMAVVDVSEEGAGAGAGTITGTGTGPSNAGEAGGSGR